MVAIAVQEIFDVWAFAVLGVALITAGITDLRRGKIYNWTTYPAIAIALIGHTLVGGLRGYEGSMGLIGSLAGLAVGFVPLGAGWAAGGVGGGDAKLMAAVGALSGWRFALAALFYGLAVAAVMAIIVMLKRRILRKTFTRVFRFLYLLVTPSKPADPAAPDSPKIPLGFALCIGAGIAIIEVAVRGREAVKFLLGI